MFTFIHFRGNDSLGCTISQAGGELWGYARFAEDSDR
jgi:hypothetical protein